jgi:hypothetical protein
MPTYKITDPSSGKTVRLTGDSPPTENELNDIFSQLRDAPNSAPTSDLTHPDHPDNMTLLAGYLKKVYGAAAGPVAEKVMGAAAPYAGKAAMAAGQMIKDSGDVMAGAAAGAAASSPYIGPTIAAAAPFLGPVAPVAGLIPPAIGGALGAAGARGIRRTAEQAAGIRPVENTSDSLAALGSAAKQGAIQEAGAKALEAGITFGINGAKSLGPAAIEKAKEVLPDVGERLIRVPSEAINRVFERFNEFTPQLKQAFTGQRRIAQAQADRVAENAFTDLTEQLSRARKIAGKRLEFAENQFTNIAGDTPVTDARNLEATLNRWKAANPDLSGSADVQKIEEAVARHTPGFDKNVVGTSGADPIPARNAVALRRRLDALSDFSATGVRPIENDAVDRLAKQLGGQVRQDIRTAAQQIGGGARYVKNLNEFSDLADAHANAIDILRTHSGTDKAVTKRVETLMSEFNKGGATQQNILNIGKGVPGNVRIESAVKHLADSLAVKSFTKQPAVVPSSMMLRLINAVAPTRTAVSAAGQMMSAPATASASYVAGAGVKAGSRLAAAMGANQTGK